MDINTFNRMREESMLSNSILSSVQQFDMQKSTLFTKDEKIEGPMHDGRSFMKPLTYTINGYAPKGINNENPDNDDFVFGLLKDDDYGLR